MNRKTNSIYNGDADDAIKKRTINNLAENFNMNNNNNCTYTTSGDYLNNSNSINKNANFNNNSDLKTSSGSKDYLNSINKNSTNQNSTNQNSDCIEDLNNKTIESLNFQVSNITEKLNLLIEAYDNQTSIIISMNNNINTLSKRITTNISTPIINGSNLNGNDLNGLNGLSNNGMNIHSTAPVGTFVNKSNYINKGSINESIHESRRASLNHELLHHDTRKDYESIYRYANNPPTPLTTVNNVSNIEENDIYSKNKKNIFSSSGNSTPTSKIIKGELKGNLKNGLSEIPIKDLLKETFLRDGLTTKSNNLEELETGTDKQMDSKDSKDLINVKDVKKNLIKKTPILSQNKYKLAYISGLPNMKVTDLKERIAQECDIHKSAIANVEYIERKNLVEMVIAGSSIKKFVTNVNKNQEISLVCAENVINSDKNGLIQRMSRVKLERVKNDFLKLLFDDLKLALESTSEKDDEYDVDVTPFTIDHLINE